MKQPSKILFWLPLIIMAVCLGKAAELLWGHYHPKTLGPSATDWIQFDSDGEAEVCGMIDVAEFSRIGEIKHENGTRQITKAKGRVTGHFENGIDFALPDDNAFSDNWAVSLKPGQKVGVMLLKKPFVLGARVTGFRTLDECSK